MVKKEFTQEEIEQIALELQDSKSPKRRGAAKMIGKNQLVELSEALMAAYQKEVNDKRTWETQVEMIKALGKIGYLPALPLMEEIVKINKPHWMITDMAASTYVRLKRRNLQDASPVIELLRFGKLSVLNGATSVLAFDDMAPPEEEIKEIIALLDAQDETEISIRGLTDPREYLLSSLRKRKDQTSMDYINHFIRSENRKLQECALLAQAGKRARYE